MCRVSYTCFKKYEKSCNKSINNTMLWFQDSLIIFIIQQLGDTYLYPVNRCTEKNHILLLACQVCIIGKLEDFFLTLKKFYCTTKKTPNFDISKVAAITQKTFFCNGLYCYYFEQKGKTLVVWLSHLFQSRVVQCCCAYTTLLWYHNYTVGKSVSNTLQILQIKDFVFGKCIHQNNFLGTEKAYNLALFKTNFTHSALRSTI